MSGRSIPSDYNTGTGIRLAWSPTTLTSNYQTSYNFAIYNEKRNWRRKADNLLLKNVDRDNAASKLFQVLMFCIGQPCTPLGSTARHISMLIRLVFLAGLLTSMYRAALVLFRLFAARPSSSEILRLVDYIVVLCNMLNGYYMIWKYKPALIPISGGVRSLQMDFKSFRCLLAYMVLHLSFLLVEYFNPKDVLRSLFFLGLRLFMEVDEMPLLWLWVYLAQQIAGRAKRIEKSASEASGGTSSSPQMTKEFARTLLSFKSKLREDIYVVNECFGLYIFVIYFRLSMALTDVVFMTLMWGGGGEKFGFSLMFKYLSKIGYFLFFIGFNKYGSDLINSSRQLEIIMEESQVNYKQRAFEYLPFWDRLLIIKSFECSLSSLASFIATITPFITIILQFDYKVMTLLNSAVKYVDSSNDKLS